MANISSAPYPRLNALLAIVAKQTQDYQRYAGVADATGDSWIYYNSSFLIWDSPRDAQIGTAYLINNLDAYGSAVQPLFVVKGKPVQTDIIVGRKDWLDINREMLLLPPNGSGYLVMI